MDGEMRRLSMSVHWTRTWGVCSMAALLVAGSACGGPRKGHVQDSGDAAEATAESKASTSELPKPTADCVDTAVAAGSFSTLVGLLQAAGIAETLKGEGPFTIFAPVDEAFAALPEGTLNALLLPESRAKLQSILKYHVVAGEYRSGAVVEAPSFNTLEGEKVDVTASEAGVKVGPAQVVTADVLCTNGVVHAIDAVLMPSSVE